MKNIFLGSIFFLWGVSAFAYIPKASMILSRTAENAGKGIYQVEQEIQFPNGADNVVLKETWLIENENTMRVAVNGGKELKDLVSFQINYANGVHNQAGQNRRLTEDFIERYFHFRSSEAFAQALSSMKIVSANVLAKKSLRNLKDAEYQPENFVHLSRVGGTVAYALGANADANGDKPGFWIEQDQFLIRKFRLPSSVEVSADRYNSYARGLNFPATRTVRWNNQQVTIQTISVKAVGKEALTAFANRTNPNKMNLGQIPAAAVIEDFYKRLR